MAARNSANPGGPPTSSIGAAPLARTQAGSLRLGGAGPMATATRSCIQPSPKSYSYSAREPGLGSRSATVCTAVSRLSGSRSKSSAYSGGGRGSNSWRRRGPSSRANTCRWESFHSITRCSTSCSRVSGRRESTTISRITAGATWRSVTRTWWVLMPVRARSRASRCRCGGTRRPSRCARPRRRPRVARRPRCCPARWRRAPGRRW